MREEQQHNVEKGLWEQRASLRQNSVRSCRNRAEQLKTQIANMKQYTYQVWLQGYGYKNVEGVSGWNIRFLKLEYADYQSSSCKKVGTADR